MATTRREVMVGAAAIGLGTAVGPALARAPGANRLIAGTYVNEGGKGLYPIVDGRLGAQVKKRCDGNRGQPGNRVRHPHLGDEAPGAACQAANDRNDPSEQSRCPRAG